VALTKTDMVEPDWLELVREDVAGLVRGTFLDGAPIVPVSSKTGAGVADLRAALRDLAKQVAPGDFHLYPNPDDNLVINPYDCLITLGNDHQHSRVSRLLGVVQGR
jgi:hypothetical protein